MAEWGVEEREDKRTRAWSRGETDVFILITLRARRTDSNGVVVAPLNLIY